MADIELVIKIDEEVYNRCKEYRLRCGEAEVLEGAVANGIPLPKGHGRLIDADAIKIDYYGEWNGLYVTEDTYKKSTIKNALTIIKADKEGEGR